MARMEMGYLDGDVSKAELLDFYDDAEGAAALAPIPPIFQGSKWGLTALRAWWTQRFGSQGTKIAGYLAKTRFMDHHLFPRQFQRYFSRHGIDIDQHTVTLSELAHLRGIHGKGLGELPGRWNQRWAEWIRANPHATAKDVYQQLGRMMDDFGLGGARIHPYGQ